jgi:hypothetical protein
MNCPKCNEEMDIVNQTPRYQINVCVNQFCPAFDRPALGRNEEYETRILGVSIYVGQPEAG